MDTKQIIERLESASGPDYAIDLDIARLQDVTVMQHNIETGGNDEATFHRYTASLDSALSLVPEGWRYGFEQAGMFDGNDLCEAWLWPFEDSFDPDWRNGDQGYRSCENAKRGAHKLHAISICIAALKAREEQ